MDYLIPILFVAFFVYLLYSVFSKRGKGKMFGGEIVKTLADTIEQKSGIQTTKIKIHVIRPKDRPHERDIGIELTNNAKLAWSMTPITLTSSESKKLCALIGEAMQSAT